MRWAETMGAPVIELVSQLRRRLGDLYGDRLRGVVLFGSHARGEAAEGSDIDVLVVLTDPVDAAAEISRTIDDVAGLSLEHDVVLSCIFVGSGEFDRCGSPFLRNIRREGVPV